MGEEALRLVLCALYRLTGGSLHAHYPREAIMRKLHPAYRGMVRKALRRLEAQGLVARKGGTDSYMLTREGLERAREWCRED